MSETVDALLRDLLEWVDREERSYTDVMDAWRTSCPRLPVWEEANDRGYVSRGQKDGVGAIDRRVQHQLGIGHRSRNAQERQSRTGRPDQDGHRSGSADHETR